MEKKVLLVFAAVMVAVGMMAQPPRQHEQRHQEPPRQVRHHESQHGRQILCATHEQLSMTLHVVGNQSMEDKKLEVAKLAVTLGHFCTDDLARIARLFTFDENRLEFLLYAHAYCEDPQNYPGLHDVFTFRSNYDELIRTLYPHVR